MQDSAIARSLWTTRGHAGGRTYFAPPTPFAEVVVATRDGAPSVFVIGPRARSSWKSTLGLTATATLHLRAGVVRSAFGVDPGAVRDLAVPAGELLDRRTVARTLEIAATSSVGEAALSLARAIAARAPRARSARLAEAALDLAAHGPRRVARVLGVSARTLRRIVGDELGVTPRELAHFARGARLLELLAAPQGRTLAAIALECGYADQAHMSNDARRLFDRSPAALARALPDATFARRAPA